MHWGLNRKHTVLWNSARISPMCFSKKSCAARIQDLHLFAWSVFGIITWRQRGAVL